MGQLFSKRNKEVFSAPLGIDNPVTVQVLGICSALAVTAKLEPAIVMGLSVTVITAFANVVISLLRKTIPNRIRIIVQLVVVAALVTIVSEILKAYAYDVSVQLSVYVGLIITNCILMGRLEAFAMQNGPWESFLDGLGNGLGYAKILIIVAFFRELLGSGTLLGFNILNYEPIQNIGYVNNGLMLMPPMALIIVAVLQNVAVFDELTVYENIDYFCGLYIKEKNRRKELVEEAIHFVGLEEYVKMRPKKLSGGLLRRLNIACGIAHKPRLIILDEPTVAVDPQSRNRILEGIKELNRQGSTIIYTSHYMEEVEQICTRIAIMDHGRCIAVGTNEELKSMIKTGETITIEAAALDDRQIQALKSLPHVFDVKYESQVLTVRCTGAKHNLVRILNYLQDENISFGRVFSELPTLNDVFLEITGKELRD